MIQEFLQGCIGCSVTAEFTPRYVQDTDDTLNDILFPRVIHGSEGRLHKNLSGALAGCVACLEGEESESSTWPVRSAGCPSISRKTLRVSGAYSTILASVCKVRLSWEAWHTFGQCHEPLAAWLCTAIVLEEKARSKMENALAQILSYSTPNLGQPFPKWCSHIWGDFCQECQLAQSSRLLSSTLSAGDALLKSDFTLDFKLGMGKPANQKPFRVLGDKEIKHDQEWVWWCLMH